MSYAGDGVQYPVFSCPACGAQGANEWQKWWDKYSGLWKDQDNWSQPKHKLACLVGFMCDAYLSFYGRPYKFSYRSPVPYKDKAFTMARRILTMFDNDALRAANYVRWAFRFKVRTRDYPVTSLGFFASSKFVMEYEHARAKARVLRRSTPLPSDFLDWCRQNEADTAEDGQLSTWNDLNGFVMYAKSYGTDNGRGRVVAEAVRRGMLPPGPECRKLEE